jgi:hypothetical protein
MRHGRPAVRLPLLLWIFALALPTLARAAQAEEAADKACQESRYIASRAERLGNCQGGFGNLPRLAGVYEKELDLPPETALALARAMRDSHEAVDKRVRERRLPAIEVMRRMEAQFILLLDAEPASTALVDEVADFYASWNLALGSPAPGLLLRVERARDPIALASRLAQRSSWYGDNSFYTEIYLAALTARPDSPGLWQQAARFARSPGFKAALFERAYRVYLGPRAAAPSPAELPVALALAGQWLTAELDNGLAAEAVAAFHALPPTVRGPLAAGRIPWVREEVPGMDFEHTAVDLRLPLAAACLLVGDRATAGELLAGTAAWPGSEDRSADILHQSLVRGPRDPEDPFGLFVRTLGNEPYSVPPAVVALALARFAESERYPGVATYCRRKVIARLADLRERWQPGQPAAFRNIPNLESLTAEAQRLEGRIESLYRTTAEAIDARTGDRAADLPPHGPRALPPPVAPARALAAVLRALDVERKGLGPCLVADPALFAPLPPDPRRIVLSVEERQTAWRWYGACELALPLIFLDRSGRRGFALWNDTIQGGILRLEEKGDDWIAERGSFWIT